MIFGHGDDAYKYGDQVKMDFSSNLPAFADTTPLQNYLATRLNVIGRYPEPEAQRLEAMIAYKLGVQANSVMVTAGATEAIYLVAQLYQGWASIIPQPTFNEYADACRMHGHILSYYDNDDMELLPEKRLYWLCNPNNPTGNVMLKTLMNHVIRDMRNYTFVVDQSYENFTQKEVLKPREMADCHNLIILHSLSKRYCMPGLRIGYITASPIIIDRLRLLRQPWTVNALAIEAGKYVLENHFSPVADMKAYLEEAVRLHDELNATKGLMLMDSDTNFMLAYIEHGTAAQLKRWLLANYGILIRDASNFHGLDNRCFRVSAQTPRENNVLIAALREYTKAF